MAKTLLLKLILSLNLLTSQPEYLDISQYSDIKLRPEVDQEKIEAGPVLLGQNSDFVSSVVSPAELAPLFSKYGEEYGVSEEVLKNIANCESHFNPNAVNGPYAGMYQFVDSTWVSQRNAMGLDSNPDLRFNAEEAIRTTAFKISRDGTGAWPVCGQM